MTVRHRVRVGHTGIAPVMAVAAASLSAGKFRRTVCR